MRKARLCLTLAVTGICCMIGAGSAASIASAEVFTLTTEACNADVLNLCWYNGSERLEVSGRQSITIAKKSGSAKVVFKGVIAEEPFTIECEGVSQGAGTSVIKQSAPLVETDSWSLKIRWYLCQLVAPAGLASKCEIPVEKESTALVGSFTSESELKLKSEVGETAPIIELEFKNKGSATCPSTFKAGLHAVTGLQVIKVLNPGVAEETKSGEAVVKSGLKLAGSAAELSGALTVSFTGLKDLIVLCDTA